MADSWDSQDVHSERLDQSEVIGSPCLAFPTCAGAFLMVSMTYGCIPGNLAASEWLHLLSFMPPLPAVDVEAREEKTLSVPGNKRNS